MTTGCLVLHPGIGVREHWAQARLIRAHTGCGWGPRPSTGIPPVSWKLCSGPKAMGGLLSVPVRPSVSLAWTLSPGRDEKQRPRKKTPVFLPWHTGWHLRQPSIGVLVNAAPESHPVVHPGPWPCGATLPLPLSGCKLPST